MGCLPLRSVTVDGPPFSVPRYLHLDLDKRTQRNVARFRLHSHALRVETRSWEHHNGACDKCGLQQFKTKNTLFSCALACKCVRWGFNLQTCFTIYQSCTKLLSIRLKLFISPKLCSEDVFNFFQKQTNDSYRFILEWMDVFLMVGVHQQPEQSNCLAEGQT